MDCQVMPASRVLYFLMLGNSLSLIHYSNILQITVDIAVIGSNDHTPIFDQNVYNTNLAEYDSISLTSSISPGQAIVTVRATDGDGPGSAAGILEYRIASGAVQFGAEMFSIPDASVCLII